MIKPLVYWPDKRLTQPTSRVGFGENYPTTVEVENLVDSMFAHGGVGLAAPQIGSRSRIFVVSQDVPTDGDWWWQGAVSELKGAWVFCNPSLYSIDNETVKDIEGCLSFPTVWLKIERQLRVQIQAYTVTGESFELGVSGFPARVIQHEYEHLSSKTMLDNMGSLKRDLITKRMTKWKKDNDSSNS